MAKTNRKTAATPKTKRIPKAKPKARAKAKSKTAINTKTNARKDSKHKHVHKVLKQIAADIHANSDDGRLLRDALSGMKARARRELLQNESHRRLVERIRTAESFYESREESPLCTLEDLCGHASEFMKFLETDRTYLIKTGLPPRFFRECPWLHVHLARLYDTRSTSSPYPPDQLFPDPLPGPEPYEWIRFQGEPQPQPCRYDEADYLPWMNTSHVDRLEHMRTKLLEIKLSVLENLTCLTSESQTETVLSACSAAIASRLNADDVKFLFQIDNHFFGRNWSALAASGVPTEPPSTYSEKNSPGGLSNIIEVILHFCVEAKLQIFGKLSRRLGPRINEVVMTEVNRAVDCFAVLLKTFGSTPANESMERMAIDMADCRLLRARMYSDICRTLMRPTETTNVLEWSRPVTKHELEKELGVHRRVMNAHLIKSTDPVPGKYRYTQSSERKIVVALADLPQVVRAHLGGSAQK